MKVMEAMMRIHRAGVMHGDFDERHVLIDDDDNIRIIDFDHASKKHVCRRMFDIEPYEYVPRQPDYKCDELHEIAKGSDVWTGSKPSAVRLR